MLITPFMELAKTTPNSPCLYRLKDDQWIAYSRGEVFEAALRLCAQWQADGIVAWCATLVIDGESP